MRLARPLATVLATVAALGLFASPAQAASYGPIKSSCSGTKLATFNLTSGMTIFGKTELWYSSANGGTNCVITHNLSGPGAWVEVHLQLDDGRAAGDSGYYGSYAGASYLTNADGHCVKVTGYVAPELGGYSRVITPWRNCG